MRFDLAINGMVLGLYKNKKIPVMRNGDQWRPFVHVKDTSKAFLTVMESPKDKVKVKYSMLDQMIKTIRYQL